MRASKILLAGKKCTCNDKMNSSFPPKGTSAQRQTASRRRRSRRQITTLSSTSLKSQFAVWCLDILEYVYSCISRVRSVLHQVAPSQP